MESDFQQVFRIRALGVRLPQYFDDTGIRYSFVSGNQRQAPQGRRCNDDRVEDVVIDVELRCFADVGRRKVRDVETRLGYECLSPGSEGFSETDSTYLFENGNLPKDDSRNEDSSAIGIRGTERPEGLPRELTMASGGIPDERMGVRYKVGQTLIRAREMNAIGISRRSRE